MHKGTFSLDKDLMKGLAPITHISSNKFQSSGSSVPVYFFFFHERKEILFKTVNNYNEILLS